MLSSSILSESQIKGVRKSLNMASIHQASQSIKDKSFMPPSSPNAPKSKSSSIFGGRQIASQIARRRKAQGFDPLPSGSSGGGGMFGGGNIGSAIGALKQRGNNQTQQKDKPILRQSGNTHREISRPLDMFSQPLSPNRVAKTKAAETYREGKDSVTKSENNNVLSALNMMQNQSISESMIYNPSNNRKLSINHG